MPYLLAEAGLRCLPLAARTVHDETTITAANCFAEWDSTGFATVDAVSAANLFSRNYIAPSD